MDVSKERIKIMQVNVGKKDRILRISSGFVIISLGMIYDSYWGLVGLVPFATGIFSWCPLYRILKINTNK